MRLFTPKHSKQTDEELMSALGKGDKRAFNEIYDRYSQPLFDTAPRGSWEVNSG